MIIPVNPMPQATKLYSNITPFTVRDNATYITVLEELRQFINDKLVPFINDNVDALDSAWIEKTQELIESWNTQSNTLITQVQTIADGLGTAVQDAVIAQNAAEAARDLAAQYASTVEAIQDDNITNIFTNLSSDFRTAFNLSLADIIIEDSDDEGTFIFEPPTAPPPTEGGVTPDPADPGFFV